VKPWFQGKLAFTFTPPEVAGTKYKLVGGKLVFLQHNPGAELLYLAGQHKVSVFIFQEAGKQVRVGSSNFNVKNWNENGLQYYLVTDASDAETAQLISLWKDANRS